MSLRKFMFPLLHSGVGESETASQFDPFSSRRAIAPEDVHNELGNNHFPNQRRIVGIPNNNGNNGNGGNGGNGKEGDKNTFFLSLAIIFFSVVLLIISLIVLLIWLLETEPENYKNIISELEKRRNLYECRKCYSYTMKK